MEKEEKAAKDSMWSILSSSNDNDDKAGDISSDSDLSLKKIRDKLRYGSDSDDSYHEEYQSFLESGLDRFLFEDDIEFVMKDNALKDEDDDYF